MKGSERQAGTHERSARGDSVLVGQKSHSMYSSVSVYFLPAGSARTQMYTAWRSDLNVWRQARHDIELRQVPVNRKQRQRGQERVEPRTRAGFLLAARAFKRWHSWELNVRRTPFQKILVREQISDAWWRTFDGLNKHHLLYICIINVSTVVLGATYRAAPVSKMSVNWSKRRHPTELHHTRTWRSGNTVVSEQGLSCCRAEVGVNMDEFGKHFTPVYVYDGGTQISHTGGQK